MDSRDPSIHSRQGIMMTTPPPYGAYHPQQHFHHNPNLIPNPTSYVVNSVSSAPLDASLLPSHQQNYMQQNGSPSGVSGSVPDAEPGRRKRGRPRKYSDGTDLVLSSNSQVESMAAGGSDQKEIAEVNGEGSTGRRQRGRPPGSGKKQLDALGGAAGSGFTPHVINILPKEDIVSKMNDFCQEGPRTIVILSTYGAVCNATIRLPGSNDENGTLCYEGCFNILSLSGPFFCMNNDGSRSNSFELTVLLSSSDGKPSGGRVVGKLIAATTVQIIAASFIAESMKSNGSVPSASSPLPIPVSCMLAFSSSATANNITIPFEAVPVSSNENGASGSHSLSHTYNQTTYNNDNNYHIQSTPIYQPVMGWGNMEMSNVHQNKG